MTRVVKHRKNIGYCKKLITHFSLLRPLRYCVRGVGTARPPLAATALVIGSAITEKVRGE